VKTIFDAETGELLGAHMVGAQVTEQIQGFGIARHLEATDESLLSMIFAHPTLSEAMHESTRGLRPTVASIKNKGGDSVVIRSKLPVIPPVFSLNVR
jgi:hypothetical protein